MKPKFGPDDFFVWYINKLSKRGESLSSDEEKRLLYQIAKGDEQAREELILESQYIVLEEILYFWDSNLEILDLIQEANLALIEALDRYTLDQNKSNLKNYLHFNIHHRIDNYVKNFNSVVRYPLNVSDLIKRTKENIDELFFESNKEVKISEICNYVESKVEKKEFVSNFFSDDFEISYDNYYNRFDFNLDLLEGNIFDKPDFTMLYKSLQEDINNAISSLRFDQADIIKKYYGLNGGSGLTLEEIGYNKNLTRERIRQIKETAISRCRHTSRLKYLEDYLSLLYSEESTKLINHSFFLSLSCENKNYFLEKIKNYLKPYRRETDYPEIENLSEYCRNLIVQIIYTKKEPINYDDIKYLVLERLPLLNENIILYSLKSDDQIIRIGKGKYALKKWGYHKMFKKPHTRLDWDRVENIIINFLKTQNVPISINYIYSRLTDSLNLNSFNSRQEYKIKQILKKPCIARTMDKRYYYIEVNQNE